MLEDRQQRRTLRSTSALARGELGRLADDEPHDDCHDQAREAHDPEHTSPGGEQQQLRGDDRPKAVAEQRDRALEDPVVHAATRGMGSFHRDGHTRGSNGSLGNTHDAANQHQAQQSGRHAAQHGQQRERHHCRHQHVAPSDAVREAPDQDGGDAPADAEHADEAADVLIVEAQVLHHRRSQRRQDEAIQADQAERAAQDEHRLQFVG